MNNVKKYNIYDICLVIILVLSAFQLGEFLVSRYFVPILALTFSILIICVQPIIKFDAVVKQVFKVHIICFSSFLLLSIFGKGEVSETLFDLTKLYFAFGSSFFVFLSVYYSRDNTISRAIRYTGLVVLSVFFLDAIVRLGDFSYDTLFLNFYIYKLNSPFFVDANALALFGLFYFAIFFFHYISLRSDDKILFRLHILFLAFFIFLTFSRAAIIALISLFVFHLLYRRKSRIKFISLSFIIIALILYLPNFIDFIVLDGSGNTKVQVYRNFIELFGLDGLRGTLFGYGINEGNFAYSYEPGKYAHATIPMVTGQFGLFGLVVYCFFFIYFIILTKGRTLYVVVPAFVVGLSYLHPFLESIFLANGFVAGLTTKRLTKLNNSS